MDIYIVLDGPRVVGVSARLQGAELIRSGEADRLVDQQVDCGPVNRDIFARLAYSRMRIENHELRDVE